MNIAGHDIAVCSWSIHPKDTAELIARVREMGLSHMQLGVGALGTMDASRRKQEYELLRSSGITITAGMIGFPGEDYSTIAAIRRTGGYVPEEHWKSRRQQTQVAAEIMRDLGVSKLSTHVGFIPPSSDPNYAVMVKRIGQIAEDLNKLNLSLVMETGQEPAPELLQFLNDLPMRNVQVNFDPANMILYGAGDPIEAIHTLGRNISHVHVKDAVISDKPGTDWGREVPFGTGEVPPRKFLEALHAVGYRGPLSIEREAGDTRMADIRAAIQALQSAAA